MTGPTPQETEAANAQIIEQLYSRDIPRDMTADILSLESELNPGANLTRIQALTATGAGAFWEVSEFMAARLSDEGEVVESIFGTPVWADTDNGVVETIANAMGILCGQANAWNNPDLSVLIHVTAATRAEFNAYRDQFLPGQNDDDVVQDLLPGS